MSTFHSAMAIPYRHCHATKRLTTIKKGRNDKKLMLQLTQHSTTVKYFIHNKVIFFFKKSFLIYNTISDKTTQFTAKFELSSSGFSPDQSKHVHVTGQGREGGRERERERDRVKERQKERDRHTRTLTHPHTGTHTNGVRDRWREEAVKREGKKKTTR